MRDLKVGQNCNNPVNYQKNNSNLPSWDQSTQSTSYKFPFLAILGVVVVCHNAFFLSSRLQCDKNVIITSANSFDQLAHTRSTHLNTPPLDLPWQFIPCAAVRKIKNPRKLRKFMLQILAFSRFFLKHFSLSIIVWFWFYLFFNSIWNLHFVVVSLWSCSMQFTFWFRFYY